MKALPTQKRALKKRSALITAAIEEFSSHGFEVATAKSIAARAEVATGTFYQYFDDKNEILRVIADDRFKHLHENVALFEPASVSTTQSNLDIQGLFEQALTFIYDFHDHDKALHQVLEQRRGIDSDLGAIMRAGEAVLQTRVLRFVQSLNFSDAEVVAENLSAMAEGLVHRHVFQQTNTDKQEVIRVGAAMLAAYFNQ